MVKYISSHNAFCRVKSTEMFNMPQSQNAEERLVAIMDIITI